MMNSTRKLLFLALACIATKLANSHTLRQTTLDDGQRQGTRGVRSLKKSGGKLKKKSSSPSSSPSSSSSPTACLEGKAGKSGKSGGKSGKSGGKSGKSGTPIDPPAVTYELTVRNGNGDGKYESGKEVKIVAGDPSEGMEFSEWVVVGGDNSLITNRDKETATVTMPSKNIKVKAKYTEAASTGSPPIPESTRPRNNTGMDRRLQSDIAAPLSVTSFKQRSAVRGLQAASGGKGKAAKCPPSSSPNSLVVTYNLIVQNGNGDGKYESGKEVEIVAVSPSVGAVFSKWVVVNGGNSPITNRKQETATVTMASENIEVKAIFTLPTDITPQPPKSPAVEYELTVQNGNGDGKYESGKVVKIVAVSPSVGAVFSKWVVVNGSNSPITNRNQATTTVIMPSENIVVKARYTEAASTGPPPIPKPTRGRSNTELSRRLDFD